MPLLYTPFSCFLCLSQLVSFASTIALLGEGIWLLHVIFTLPHDCLLTEITRVTNTECNVLTLLDFISPGMS